MNKTNRKTWLLPSLLFLAGIFIGLYILKPFLPSYEREKLQTAAEIRENKRVKKEGLSEAQVIDNTLKRYYLLDEEYQKTDPRRLISIHNQEDVETVRKKLINTIWGVDQLPKISWQKANSSELPFKLENVTLGALETDLPSGFKAHVDIITPQPASSKAMIYHLGHSDTLASHEKMIKALVAGGYTVVIMNMPVQGNNHQPIITLENGTSLKLTEHDQLKFLDHPLQYFLTPVIGVVDYLSELSISDINMMGMEGGGWTTTVAAAIDTRIRRSYPISGSYPLFLRSGSTEDWGDFEQSYPPLFGKIDYMDLYILGALGQGRRQLQIINQFNYCCFSGVKYQTYENPVSETVKSLNGQFRIFLDDTSMDYDLSPVIISEIMADLRR